MPDPVRFGSFDMPVSSGFQFPWKSKELYTPKNWHNIPYHLGRRLWIKAASSLIGGPPTGDKVALPQPAIRALLNNAMRLGAARMESSGFVPIPGIPVDVSLAHYLAGVPTQQPSGFTVPEMKHYVANYLRDRDPNALAAVRLIDPYASMRMNSWVARFNNPRSNLFQIYNPLAWREGLTGEVRLPQSGDEHPWWTGAAAAVDYGTRLGLAGLATREARSALRSSRAMGIGKLMSGKGLGAGLKGGLRAGGRLLGTALVLDELTPLFQAGESGNLKVYDDNKNMVWGRVPGEFLGAITRDAAAYQRGLYEVAPRNAAGKVVGMSLGEKLDRGVPFTAGDYWNLWKYIYSGRDTTGEPLYSRYLPGRIGRLYGWLSSKEPELTAEELADIPNANVRLNTGTQSAASMNAHLSSLKKQLTGNIAQQASLAAPTRLPPVVSGTAMGLTDKEKAVGRELAHKLYFANQARGERGMAQAGPIIVSAAKAVSKFKNSDVYRKMISLEKQLASLGYPPQRVDDLTRRVFGITSRELQLRASPTGTQQPYWQ